MKELNYSSRLVTIWKITPIPGFFELNRRWSLTIDKFVLSWIPV